MRIKRDDTHRPALLFDEGKAPAKVVDKPMALSQMPKAKTPSRPIAKGHEDKVDDADLE